METTSLVQPEILKSFKSVKRTLYNNNNYYYHIHHPDPQIKKIRKSHKLSFEHGNLLKSAIQHVTEVSTITVPESSRNLVKLPTVPAYQPTDYNSSAKNFSTAGIMENLSNRSGSSMQCSTWKIYRVISNHLGCVRCVAFDPSNKWFCTGSADRTIKIWDVASGRIKHTLTGHIGQVRSVAVSDRHTYMFSAGDDKQCWDLEHNKVTRSFYGHLSGVYCLALHPSIDVLITGGRDSVGRVWDIRTKKQIFALSGHDNTVCSVFARSSDPQVVTGSHDTTVKFWDLRSGKTMETLTHHKKSVRTLVHHPVENNFVSAAADNVKKFNLPKGELMHNMVSEQKTIINAMAVNRDGVLVAGGDDGSMSFWDWKTGQKFQRIHTTAQQGSLDCEAAIYAAAFDVTGSRLVTCEADKTIKMWKQDTK